MFVSAEVRCNNTARAACESKKCKGITSETERYAEKIYASYSLWMVSDSLAAWIRSSRVVKFPDCCNRPKAHWPWAKLGPGAGTGASVGAVGPAKTCQHEKRVSFASTTSIEQTYYSAELCKAISRIYRSTFGTHLIHLNWLIVLNYIHHYA